jgi:hypothetical protein
MDLGEARMVLAAALAPDRSLEQAAAIVAGVEDAVRVILRDEMTRNAFVHDFGDSDTVEAAEIRFR